MNEKWVKLDKLACLYVEKVLIRFDIPLLFVCNTQESNIKYLTLCTNEETDEFLLAECNNAVLLELLREKQSIDGVFKMAEKLFLVDCCNNLCKSLSIEEVSGEMLPDDNTFFTIKNKSIDEYIEKLANGIMNIPYKVDSNLCVDIGAKDIKNKQKSIEHTLIQLVENIIPHDNILDILYLPRVDKLDNVSKNIYKVDKGVANGQGKKDYFTSAA